MVFCRSPYGSPKLWPELNKLPVISLVRWVYSESVENCNSWFVFMVSCEQVPAHQGEKNIFIEEKEELGRDIVNIESLWLFIGWIFAGKKSFFLFWVPLYSQSWELLLLISQPYLIDVSFYLFFLYFWKLSLWNLSFFSNCHSILSFPSCLDVHFIEVFFFFFLFYEFWLYWIPCGSWASL